MEKLKPNEQVAFAACVNRRWLRVCTSGDIWRLRFDKKLPTSILLRLEGAQLRDSSPAVAAILPRLWHQLYCTNLLRNPNWHLPGGGTRSWLTDPNGAWKVTTHGGHGFAPEFPPVGMPTSPPAPLPRPDGHPAHIVGALASSYMWSEIMQAVDLRTELLRRGFSGEEAEAYLDAGAPLHLTVWYGGRTDCAGVADVSLVVDTGEVVLPNYTGGMASFFWDRNALACWRSGELPSVAGEWRCAVGELSGYPPGARRAMVVVRGKDSQFWAGNYGAKFASPSLTFACACTGAAERAAVDEDMA
ncbi:hypothetical protein WJX81_000752 [Elliptochloris bilobata]|uniref:FBA domain-containing protein n=1 Tax=Elliptochloris bilobata TaxID=381761 RepID=A0AAW1RGN2_9CHLO